MSSFCKRKKKKKKIPLEKNYRFQGPKGSAMITAIQEGKNPHYNTGKLLKFSFEI